MSFHSKRVGAPLNPPNSKVGRAGGSVPTEVAAVNAVGQAALLRLPSDLLRMISSLAGRDMQIVCRFVCRRLRDVIPPTPERKKICPFAAAEGHLEVIKWAHPQNKPCEASAMAYAALNGHLEILKWHYGESKPDLLVASASAVGGHLETLKWIKARGFYMGTVAYTLNEDTEKKLTPTGTRLWGLLISHHAARLGKFEVLQWAVDLGAPWDVDIGRTAVKFGQLELLKNWNARGSFWTKTGVYAAFYGKLEILQWDLGNDPNRISTSIQAAAALGAHLPILKYLRGLNNTEWDKALPVVAPHRDTQILVKIGLVQSWADQIHRYAALKDKLDVIRWALGEGAPFDAGICCTAAAKGSALTVLKWLRAEKKISWDFPTPDFILTELSGMDTFYNRVIAYAVVNNRPDVIEWARDDFLS